jgi:hypothetical protein
VGGASGTYGRVEKVYNVLLGKPERKIPFGRARGKWEDGITIGLREIGSGVWSGFKWLRIGACGGLL